MSLLTESLVGRTILSADDPGNFSRDFQPALTVEPVTNVHVAADAVEGQITQDTR